MNNVSQTKMPPIVSVIPMQGKEASKGNGKSSSAQTNIKSTMWALYGLANGLQATKTWFSNHTKSNDQLKKIDLGIDSVTDAVNALIAPKPTSTDEPPEGFLTEYYNEIESGKWPPVDPGFPPAPTPTNGDAWGDILKTLEAFINSAIIKFGAGKKGGAVENGLIALENALTAIVADIKKYFPNFLNSGD